MNAILHGSLPQREWEIRISQNIAELLKDSPCLLDYGTLVFSLMSGDEARNLTDAIALLRFLNDVASQQELAVLRSFIDPIDEGPEDR